MIYGLELLRDTLEREALLDDGAPTAGDVARPLRVTRDLEDGLRKGLRVRRRNQPARLPGPDFAFWKSFSAALLPFNAITPAKTQTTRIRNRKFILAILSGFCS